MSMSEKIPTIDVRWEEDVTRELQTLLECGYGDAAGVLEANPDEVSRARAARAAPAALARRLAGEDGETGDVAEDRRAELERAADAYRDAHEAHQTYRLARKERRRVLGRSWTIDELIAERPTADRLDAAVQACEDALLRLARERR